MNSCRLLADGPRCLLPAILASGLVVSSVRGQEVPIELQDIPVPELPDGNRAYEGVYLDDSFEAESLLQEAFEHAAAADWNTALDKLDQTLKQYERKVIASADATYISVRRFLHAQIARWPDEGLRAYRKRYEPAAKSLLAQAVEDHDEEKLWHVFGHYFCTASAIQAADLLSQMLLEQGRLGETRSIFDRLLADHPDRQRFMREWRAKQAVYLALSGKVEQAKTHLHATEQPIADYAMEWRGGRTVVQNILQEIEANPILESDSADVRGWPTFGGNASRTLLPHSNISPTAPLWTFDGFAPSTLSGADGYFQSSSYRSAYNRGKFLVFQPAVDKGRVFFNDSFRVWAVDQETGTQAWSYQGVTPSDQLSGWGDRSVPSLHSCTVFDDRVYVDLGHRPGSYYGYQPPTTRSLLVCLDAVTGRKLWKARPQDYGEDPREVEFEGPVVVDARGVYILARRRKAFGFEDSYLWKFDHTGQYRWRTHLASGSTGGFGYRRPTLAVPMLVEGVIYVQTNLGAVAAVNANTGLIDWISVYGTTAADQQGRWESTRSNEIFPWQYCPIFPIPDEQLISAPLDSEDVLLFNRRTGRIRWRIPKRDLHDLQSILGVVNGLVYAVGEKLFCWDARSRESVWAVPLPESPLYGRGALSDSRIYLPCRSGLFTYSINSSEPAFKPWDHTQQGGNVIVLPESMVVAGNDRITLYGLREDVFARLQRRMDAYPSDISAAVKMAEVAYRTAFSQPPGPDKHADYRRGAQALNEAIRRAGGIASIWDEQFKRRLFHDFLEFSKLHLKDEPADLDAAIGLLIKAGLCPPDSESLLLQKSLLASAYEQREDFASQIHEYHQIMRDRSLHDLQWPNQQQASGKALNVCRIKIAELIERHGREAYRPIEDKAATMLAGAIQAQDLVRLDYIISVMPNSHAAPKALLAKASILLQHEDQPVQAARAYYSALTRYPALINRAYTLRQIADCYVHAGQRTAAWQWLTKASREFPEALLDVDGQSLTFLEYRAKLGNIEHLLHMPLPRIVGRPHAQYRIELGAESRVLYPEFNRHRAAAWSRFLISGVGGLMAIDAVSGAEAWPERLASRRQPRLLAALRHAFVIATHFEIAGVEPGTGKFLWQYGKVDPRVDDGDADPEDFPRWSLHRIHENLLISTRSDGKTICIDHENGKVVWNKQLRPAPAQALAVDDDLVVYRATSGDEQSLAVLSSSDGALQRIIPLTERRPILKILSTLAGNFVLVSSQSVLAVDPLTGREDWHVEFDRNLSVRSVHVVLDGVILSADGWHVIKLSLDDGRQEWRSDGLGLRPSELRIFVDQDELYAANERRVFSLDILTGATLGSAALPTNSLLEYFELLEGRVALIGTTLPHENQPSSHWLIVTDRPAHFDGTLDPHGAEAESLGSSGDSLKFYAFDHAIIGFSKDALHGWTAPTGTKN